MSKSNLIICGNGHGLQCIYEGLSSNKMDFIVCSDDQSILDRARKDCKKTVKHYLDAINSKFDIVLTSSYKPKIPREDLLQAQFLNIHYALLPKYRGMHAIVWAILNGDSHVGYTLHETSELLDQGSIVFQEAVEVGKKTSWELMLLIDQKVKHNICDLIDNYRTGKIKIIPQNEEDAIYVAPRNLSDCRIKWDIWNTTYFRRAFQALVPPYPEPFFYFKDEKILIKRATITERKYHATNGQIVYLDQNDVWVKIPGGLLKVNEIIMAGNKLKAIDVFKKIGIRFY